MYKHNFDREKENNKQQRKICGRRAFQTECHTDEKTKDNVDDHYKYGVRLYLKLPMYSKQQWKTGQGTKIVYGKAHFVQRQNFEHLVNIPKTCCDRIINHYYLIFFFCFPYIHPYVNFNWILVFLLKFPWIPSDVN